MGDSAGAALSFIGVFYAIMFVPCVGAAVLGTKLINKLGRFPSKTPVIQLGILFPLVVLEVVSFTMMLVFFKLLTAE